MLPHALFCCHADLARSKTEARAQMRRGGRRVCMHECGTAARGSREVPEEQVIVGGICLNAGPRSRVVAERAVRLEKGVAEQDVLVIFVAEHAIFRRQEPLPHVCGSASEPRLTG